MCTPSADFSSIVRTAARAFETAAAEVSYASSNNLLTALLRRDDARARRDNLFTLAALRDIARRNGTALVAPRLAHITAEDVAAASA
jgi:hypothetical protein